MNSKIRNSFSFYWKILKNSISRFISEDTFTQSAALAYYVVLSLPPMLLMIFWSVGLWYKESLIREAVFDEFGDLIGQDGANQLMNTIEGLSSNKPTWFAAIIGAVTLLFMVSTVFVTIKYELNRIFEVKVKRSFSRGIWMMLFDRFLSIAMLSIFAFILTLSMIISTLITSFGEMIKKWIGDYTTWLLLFNSILLNLIFLTLLFALSYRYMPDSRLKWRDTWFGAFFTAILFVIGKTFIAIFIGNSQVANFYEAAGSILVLMLWVYYTSAIYYFGATVTHFRAKLLEENKS